ncbi:MAG: tRNA (adenosine(37)-N6)-threonylcarbamoyltransferase complex ATPase subunit type 1 TsaE [Bacteroidales bacterium]|nr:tRNA (adenosine(37)-N6)-threonylcarbamoyltransferase complex ATPase subunit type 1 TsaE [Bacteroidales bacterium]
MHTFIINKLEETKEIAKKVAELLTTDYNNRKCLAFLGEMGAGKTTFIKELCKAMKVIDEISSPTFSIVNEYATENGENIYHFDLYRLKDIEEAMSAGAEEYIYSNNYCMIEWPEIIYPILPSDTIYIKIEEIEDKKRKFTIDIEIN